MCGRVITVEFGLPLSGNIKKDRLYVTQEKKREKEGSSPAPAKERTLAI